MRRRAFIAAAGAVLVAVPGIARAQQRSQPRRIVIASVAVPVAQMVETNGDPYFMALREELRRLSWVEGTTSAVEHWVGEGRPDRYRAIVDSIAAAIRT